MRPVPLVSSSPGDRRWPEFVAWVRQFLYLDRTTGLICYRPRDAAYFSWSDRPEAEARAWNSGSAGRAIMVRGRSRYARFCRFDGALARWADVRMALGAIGKDDPNRDLPDPKDLTDAEIVDTFGLEYALMRHGLAVEVAEKKATIFAAAVARYEARIGRSLAAHEKEIARAATHKL